jgi:SAM-dependent methyltransferase
LPFPAAARSVHDGDHFLPGCLLLVIFTCSSFHHFLAPHGVLGEMVRVCKPGGKVAVVDVFASSEEQAEAYDREERLRDPSHARTLLLEELTGLFQKAGLLGIKTAFYELEVDLEDLLASLFPSPGDADGVRHPFQDDLGVNRMGFDAYRKEGRIGVFFPIVIVARRKAEAVK